MRAARVLVHAALLTAPLAVLGRLPALARPQAVACVLAVLLLAEIEAASRTTPDPSRVGAPGTGLALASALGLLGTAWAAIGFPSAPSPSWAWLGVPLVLLGTALRAAAIRALGESFTSEIVATPGHALIRRGIYAYLRHPSDLGLLVIAGGLAVLGTSLPAAVLALVVVFPSVALRILREERALSQRHPKEHASYRREVGLTGWQRRAPHAPIYPTK
jgi:protein-S-isoprenylcysteine O-methyltransferase Ste14